MIPLSFLTESLAGSNPAAETSIGLHAKFTICGKHL
jgi:hypothetical protein